MVGEDLEKGKKRTEKDNNSLKRDMPMVVVERVIFFYVCPTVIGLKLMQKNYSEVIRISTIIVSEFDTSRCKIDMKWGRILHTLSNFPLSFYFSHLSIMMKDAQNSLPVFTYSCCKPNTVWHTPMWGSGSNLIFKYFLPPLHNIPH